MNDRFNKKNFWKNAPICVRIRIAFHLTVKAYQTLKKTHEYNNSEFIYCIYSSVTVSRIFLYQNISQKVRCNLYTNT